MSANRTHDSRGHFAQLARGRGRGPGGRGGSNLRDDAVIANSTDTEASETRPVQNNRRRGGAPGPYHPPSDDESHLTDVSEIGSSPPRYDPIHAPDSDADYVNATPPLGYGYVSSPPPSFSSNPPSGAPEPPPSATTQRTTSSGPVIYTPSESASNSGHVVYTPSSTNRLASSSGRNMNTPFERPHASSSTVRPEPSSPERIRDSEEARRAKPRMNTFPGPPPPRACTEEYHRLNVDHPPPGYTRTPSLAVRKNPASTMRWGSGVLSGGAMINMLEDLSYSTKPGHERMCLWLQEHYATPFGRFHTGDGLVIRTREHLDMLANTHCMWVEFKGIQVETDIFFVPGLEPRTLEGGYQQRRMDRLPPLPRDHAHETRYAGSVQYKHEEELPRKGNMVERY
jgi:hypothetical protein